MGYNALPPAHSSLSFGVIYLFEHVLAPGIQIPQVAYLKPTLGYILLLFSFNFKLTFYNFKLTYFKACRPGYFKKWVWDHINISPHFHFKNRTYGIIHYALVLPLPGLFGWMHSSLGSFFGLMPSFSSNFLVKFFAWWCFDLLDEHEHKEVRLLIFLFECWWMCTSKS